MGSTFSSVQVHRGDAAMEGSLALLVEALTALAHEQGYVSVAADETAQRTILIGSGDDLFHHGVLLAQFCSKPDYFVKAPASERRASQGNAEKWSTLLAPESQHRLTSAFADARKKKGQAEDSLSAIADIIELSVDRAQLGYNYAARQPDALISLRFRAKQAPAWRTPASGPPAFEAVGSSLLREVVVGSEVAWGASVRNSGGAFQGVRVFVSGELVSKGMLALENVRLVWHVAEQVEWTDAVPVPADHPALGRVSVAHFPDHVVSAGLNVPFEQELGLSRADQDRVWNAGYVSATVTCQARAVGSGQLRVTFAPHDTFEGQHSVEIDVSVQARPRRPLRALKSFNSRCLEDGQQLIALATFDADRTTAAAAAAQLIERWVALFDPDDHLSWLISPFDSSVRGTVGKAKLRGFTKSARWKKLRREPGESKQLQADRRSPSPLRTCDGFFFNAGAAEQSLADPELPTLALWLDTRDLSAERVATANQLASRRSDLRPLAYQSRWLQSERDS